MDWIVVEGKDRDTAIQVGLQKLGITLNEAETRDIGEIKKLFGLGETVFRIRIRKRENGEPAKPAPTTRPEPARPEPDYPRAPVKDIYAGYRSGTEERPPRREDRPRREERHDRHRREERPYREERSYRDERSYREDRPRREDRWEREERPARREERPERREEERSAEPTPEELELVRNIESILIDILEGMSIHGDVQGTLRAGGRIELKISSENGGLLIGKQGSTLEALQHIMEIIANKQSDRRYRVVLDTENYRDRKKEKLEDLARKLADKAKQTGKPVPCSPMKASERKLIHSYLQNDSQVETRSEGEGMKRRVVIYPRRPNRHR
jgi:spoIIIJ-associated protein